jgi:hypothetical protein
MANTSRKQRKASASVEQSITGTQPNTQSPILGYATIRIMGRSGDAQHRYPRIQSLDALGQLSTEEQAAVREAQRVVREAQQKGNSVMAVTPSVREDEQPRSRRLGQGEFDPAAEQLVIVPRVKGGAL